MNKLRPILDIGMPYHGKALGGTLTLTGGTKAVNGEGGAIVVRHPSAPGSSRNAAQQAHDLANGLEWRDYALLCGNSRYVNGGPALGANAWLYCAPDGRTWRMTIEKTYTSGDTATFEIWRREQFGRSGRAYTITDEKVGETVITFAIPSEYSGSQTAANCASNAAVNLAAAIVPNPAGNSIYLHVLCNNDVYVATRIFIGGSEREVAAIIEVALSGSGDVDNTGIGVSATFPNTEMFDSLRTVGINDLDIGQSVSSLTPDWDDCSQTSDNGPPTPEPPGSAGLIYDRTIGYTPAHKGVTNTWQTGAGTYQEATVFRTHLGDVTQQLRDYSTARRVNQISSGTWEKTDKYFSVGDGGSPETFSWQYDSTTYNANLWHSSIVGDTGGGDGYVSFGEGFDIQFGAFSYGDSWDWSDGYTTHYYNPQATGGSWCTNGWPITPPAAVHTAESFTSTFGALSGGMSVNNLSLGGSVQIFPGYMIVGWAYSNPNNDGNRSYFYRFIGFGETQGVLWDSYDFQYSAAVIPPPTTLIPYKHAFQPVTEDGDYGLGVLAPGIQYC